MQDNYATQCDFQYELSNLISMQKADDYDDEFFMGGSIEAYGSMFGFG